MRPPILGDVPRTPSVASPYERSVEAVPPDRPPTPLAAPTTTQIVRDREVQVELHGLLPPLLLVHLCEQGASVLSTDGKRVWLGATAVATSSDD